MTNIVPLVKAGIDIGNSTTCAAVQYTNANGDEVIKHVFLPTVKSVRSGSGGAHAITREIDGARFTTLIGDGALNAAATGTARGNKERYFSGFTLDFVLVALASAVNHAEFEAEIAVGVPAAYYNTLFALEVEKALKGKHVFEYRGKARSILISSVQVCQEGVAALELIDADGPTMIIDIGGGTINVVLSRNGEIKGGTFDGSGMDYVLDDADQMIVANGGRALSEYERRELLKALVNGDDYAIVVGNQERNVSKLVRNLIDGKAGFAGAAKTALDFIGTKANIGDFANVYLIGGAARDGLWGKRLRELIPVAKRISDKPEMDNANGLLVKAGGKRKKGKR